MPAHIGIIGCSAEGAALCYRSICQQSAQRLGQHAHPEISMHTHSLADYVACQQAHDWQGIAALMQDSARKLTAAGADFLVCPDNTIHQVFDQVAAHSPLPWLHIAEVVAQAAAARGFARVGLTGTHWLVESAVYPDKLAAHGIACVRPDAQARAEISRIIMEELVAGVFKPASIAFFQQVIAGFAAQGCDAVVLGCTEIPLILHDGNSPLPTLDSTRLLAQAALERALAG